MYQWFPYIYEWLMHLCFSVSGAVLVICFSSESGKKNMTNVSVSYFLGMILFFYVALICFLLKVSFSFVSSIVLVLCLIALILNFNKISFVFVKRLLIFLLISQTIFALVIATRINIMSFDSYHYVLLAKQLAFGSDSYPWLIGYSFSLPSIQAIAMSTFGIDVFNSLLPVSTIAALAVLVIFLCDQFAEHRKLIWPILALILLAFTSCYFYFFGAFYLIPNMLAGSLVMIMVISSFHFSSHQKIWFVTFFGCLLFFSLLRVEGFVFSLLLLPFYFIYLADQKIKLFSFQNFLYLMFLLSCLTWFLYMYNAFPSLSGAFYSTSKLKALLAISISLLFVPVILKSNFIRNLAKHYYLLIAFLGIVVCGVLAVAMQDKAIENAVPFLKNVFFKGSWGQAWFWVLIPFVVALFSQVRKQYRNNFISNLGLFIIAFICFIFAIFFFREVPIRIGFGDSSNRMLLHIYPSVMLFLSYSFAHLVTHFIDNFSYFQLSTKSKTIMSTKKG